MPDDWLESPEAVSRWVDVRLHREDGQRAMAVIADRFAPVTMRFDPNPRSAVPGEEVELSVQDRRQPVLEEALRAQGIPILAARTRLAESLVPFR